MPEQQSEKKKSFMGLKKLRRSVEDKSPKYHCDNCGCNRYSPCGCKRKGDNV